MAKSGFASGFAGFLIGVVTGLGVAAGAMLVIAKSPVPFVDKVDKVTADVDPAAKLAGAVDPNARLNQTAGEEPTGETGLVQTVTVVDKDPKSKSAAPSTANTRAATPAATFWVQVGAFRQKTDAINSSAALGMQGIIAQVQEGGPAGWRVRVGPFDSRPDAREMLDRLTDQGLSPTIVEQK